MKNKNLWILLAVIVVVLGVGFYFRTQLASLIGWPPTAQARTTAATDTVAIRPAADINQVSAAGNIALVSQLSAVLQVNGIINQIAVAPGDNVKPGDLLLSLDTTDLERAVQQAQLNVASSQAALDKLVQPAKPEDIAAAQAGLVSVQASRAELQAGPDATKLAAAKTALAAAQAKYQELLAGPDEAQKTQLAAAFHKAAITLQNAQEAYNKIAFQSNIGSTQQAIDLQNATIDYDTAKAAYEEATKPAIQSDLQNALNAIKTAQSQFDDLQPTKAQLADAEAQVASAKATLAALVNGPTEAERREAELALEQAKLSLEEAQTNLDRSQLKSPISGTILAVNVGVGQQATSGLDAVNLADLTALELTVNVAEVDIRKVHVGQAAKITIDAMPDQEFSGAVSRITPASASESGVVNYPVTIRLNNLNLDGVRPGMTAVTTLVGDSSQTQWLVPSNSLVEFEGEKTVAVVRGDQRVRVKVTPGTSQGEWTVVQSDELQAGDKVVGSVASNLNAQNNSNQPRGFFGGGGGGRPPQ